MLFISQKKTSTSFLAFIKRKSAEIGIFRTSEKATLTVVALGYTAAPPGNGSCKLMFENAHQVSLTQAREKEPIQKTM